MIAPAIELHPEEAGRLEYKTFEATGSPGDLHAYFLLWLELLLDDGLRGRAGEQTRIYDLGSVARDGLAAETVAERAAEVLGAPRRAGRLGLRPPAPGTLPPPAGDGPTPGRRPDRPVRARTIDPGRLEASRNLDPGRGGRGKAPPDRRRMIEFVPFS